MSLLRCHICGLPWGRLQDGVLIIESRHHGEKHTNAVMVEKLLEVCQEVSGEQVIKDHPRYGGIALLSK